MRCNDTITRDQSPPNFKVSVIKVIKVKFIKKTTCIFNHIHMHNSVRATK